ncbi:DUF4394 domain-containing protein [Mesorhizobium sp. SB112]|uniref:DUF4394 domain-containing protein n=1 Tax=Mesorhizobium sp. SB112 TaxID=3151853 RepID=UPI0032664C68
MTIISKIPTICLAAGASLLALSVAGHAAPAVGLTGEKTLVWFDTDKPEVSKTVEVEGVDTLIGIDLRPADNKLYGVAGDGTIVTIDLETGAATAGAKLGETLPEGVKASVDFNPMADRLRVMGSDGTNLRAHPDTGEVTVDGKLNFEAGDANAEKTPEIVATAYLNSFGKPEKTAMYDIDAAGNFIQQTAPNDGTLKTIGSLGIESATTFAFDIQTTEDGTNTPWVAAGGALYKVNLETGAAEKTADITGVEGDLRDIAILPAM